MTKGLSGNRLLYNFNKGLLEVSCFTLHSLFVIRHSKSARGGTRTLTSYWTHAPQTCLSTNFSTRADTEWVAKLSEK